MRAGTCPGATGAGAAPIAPSTLRRPAAKRLRACSLRPMRIKRWRRRTALHRSRTSDKSRRISPRVALPQVRAPGCYGKGPRHPRQPGHAYPQSSAASEQQERMMVALTFPDGARREYPKGTTGLDIAKGISPSLAKRTVAMALDGALTDLNDPIERDAKVEFLIRE